MIQFFFEDIDPIEINPKTSDWLEHLLLKEEKKLGKINYIFLSDEGLLKVNQDFLKHDYYTDIITFDYVKGKTISADIFVFLPRILENAKLFSKDFNTELHRVLAHGLLHLCGYKDKTDEDKAEMRNKENFYLNIF